MKQDKTTIKTYFETGDKPTQQQYSDLIDSYIDTKQPTGEANRRFVIEETGDVSIASEQKTPEYTLSEITNNKLALLKDGEIVKEIDLTPYIDDTNLSRLVSGTVDANGVATFTRDDNSTFTVDLSNLNVGVPYTGATKDVDLGQHTLKIGKQEINSGFSKHEISLLSTQSGLPLIRKQTEYLNSTNNFITTFGLGFGEETIKNNRGVNCLGIGHYALTNNTGNYTIGIGGEAGRFNTGNNSIFSGYSSGQNNTGSNTNGFGINALLNNSGNESSGIGANVLSNNTGNNVNGIGLGTLSENSGHDSNGLGSYALQFNKGNNSIALGHKSLRYNEGINAIGIGYNAMQKNKGETSLGIGYNSLFYNLGSLSNGIGNQTLIYNQGDNNNALGNNSFSNFQDYLPNKQEFNSTNVDNSQNRISITSHGFGTPGKLIMLRYNNVSGSKLGSFNNSSLYQFKIIDPNTIESYQSITSTNTGTHELTPQYTYNNTTTIGAYSQPTKSDQIVLGSSGIKEVTTAGDYISTGIGKGLILKTPDGNKSYRLSIDNSGNITTTLI
ncbi:hypothetical protein DS884_06815 [Tenacibaculum sp. E3R01]|uniref:hypothetical protein n=1 Tax=Tenacibaculum sp. E3R01 TaxID=2267227 RepID=UPI000DE84E46|nr:hypothetical protein [Tenacibaculum sp. E3R01]RBW59445.1 hypothetical protein DS884_06815 [Tenacibaculum sp. E3R01]